MVSILCVCVRGPAPQCTLWVYVKPLTTMDLGLKADVAATLRHKPEEGTVKTMARVRARLKNVVIELWRHKQDIKRGRPKALHEKELPSTNVGFAAAMAQVILEHYGVPYRTVVGSFTHWCLEKDKSYPAIWLETPKPRKDGRGWVAGSWAYVTDLAVFAESNKINLCGGQKFKVTGAPRSEEATYYASHVFDQDGTLAVTYEPHPYVMDEETSLTMLASVGGALREEYVLARNEEADGDKGLYFPTRIHAYFRAFQATFPPERRGEEAAEETKDE